MTDGSANSFCIPKGNPLFSQFHSKKESMRELICNKYDKWFWGQLAYNTVNHDIQNELDKYEAMAIEKLRLNIGCVYAPGRSPYKTILDYLAWTLNKKNFATKIQATY